MPKSYVTGRGNYNAICDVCGFKYKASELRKRWDGWMVCKDDFELRHPSDFYRVKENVIALPFSRPESTPIYYGIFDYDTVFNPAHCFTYIGPTDATWGNLVTIAIPGKIIGLRYYIAEDTDLPLLHSTISGFSIQIEGLIERAISTFPIFTYGWNTIEMPNLAITGAFPVQICVNQFSGQPISLLTVQGMASIRPTLTNDVGYLGTYGATGLNSNPISGSQIGFTEPFVGNALPLEAIFIPD